MELADDQELANTEDKLALLEKQTEIAKLRPPTDANRASLRSLNQMADQLRGEIARYCAARNGRGQSSAEADPTSTRGAV